MELNNIVCAFAAVGWLIATALVYLWWSAGDDLRATQNLLAALERDHRELIAMSKRRDFLAAKCSSHRRSWSTLQQDRRALCFVYREHVEAMLFELANRGDRWAQDIVRQDRDLVIRRLDEWIALEKGESFETELVA